MHKRVSHPTMSETRFSNTALLSSQALTSGQVAGSLNCILRSRAFQELFTCGYQLVVSASLGPGEQCVAGGKPRGL